MSEPRPAFSGMSISDRNPMGFRKKGFLLRLSTHLGKLWKTLFLSSVFCLSGCLSHVLYHPSARITGDTRGYRTSLRIGFFGNGRGGETLGLVGSLRIPAGSPFILSWQCRKHLRPPRFYSDLQPPRAEPPHLRLSGVWDRAAGSPSEQGIYRDTEAAWNYLEQIRGIDPQKIVVFGRSLGDRLRPG